MLEKDSQYHFYLTLTISRLLNGKFWDTPGSFGWRLTKTKRESNLAGRGASWDCDYVTMCSQEVCFRFPSGGVGHGPRDQFCPITSLQMVDWFFHLCAGSLFDFLRFSPFIKWFTIIFFGKVWVDRCSKPQFLKQYNVCLFSIDIVRCNSSCA